MLLVFNLKEKAKYILILTYFLLNQSFALDVKTYIPKNAESLLPVVKSETSKHFTEMKRPEYIAGLIEQESCISLTHSRCWSPTSELKNTREQGIGLGMITRAFRADGGIRFDSLSDLRNKHINELYEFSWDTVKNRPDLQIRALLLMSRDNYKSLYTVKNDNDRLKMTDAAYNAGLGRIIKDRTKCNLIDGCNSQLWDDNVELTCTASRTPIAMYGNKSPCRINREHVYNVFNIRMPKYKNYYDSISNIQPVPKTDIVQKTVVNEPIVSYYWDRKFYLDFFFKYD